MIYFVGTPIGNLDDISFRQAKIISESDIILAEDTRSYSTLLQGILARFNFKTNPNQIIISYYKDREFEKLPYILEQNNQNKNISLITESGMPLISDPGFLLLSTLKKRNIPFTVIPGPSAVTTALIYSGMNPLLYQFLGFIPKKGTEIEKLFTKLQQIKSIFPDLTFVLFESPHRIQSTLSILDKIKWNPDIVIARELSKKFEEIIHGKVSELLKKEYKGEIVLLLH